MARAQDPEARTAAEGLVVEEPEVQVEVAGSVPAARAALVVASVAAVEPEAGLAAVVPVEDLVEEVARVVAAPEAVAPAVAAEQVREALVA